MSETITDLPAGKTRYVRTLVRTGLSYEVAYTLAEDVTAMAGANIAEKLGAQSETINALAREVDSKLGAQTTVINSLAREVESKLDAQTKVINALTREVDGKLDAQAKVINALARRMDSKFDAQNEVISAQTAKIDVLFDILGENGKEMRSMETRFTGAMQSMETRFAEATKSSETRLGTQYSRLVDHQLKLLWVVVGTGVLAMLAVIAKWVIEALGF